MKPNTKAYLVREGGKIASDFIRIVMASPKKPATSPERQEEASPSEEVTIEPARPPKIEQKPAQEAVATACVPCALGHFSTTAGLLNEAVRFKAEGITSNEVLDRIAKTLEELNTLERVDLTPEKIRSAPPWERQIAEEALQQSRGLRHRLETITTIEELEQAAADTEGYYRVLNRVWWKQRFAKLGKVAEPEMTLDEAKKMAAGEAAKEVERQWDSQEKKSTT